MTKEIQSIQNAEQVRGRRHRRADLSVYVNKIVGDEPHMARVRDISAGGVYLFKLLEPQRGEQQQIGLEIMLPGYDDVIWALGEVVREDTHERMDRADGVAVRFLRIAESDRALIREYIAEEETGAFAA